MEIVLYTNTAADDHLTPSLGTGLTFSNCVLKHEADVDTPVFELQTDTNLAAYNYARIARYGRYYWVKPRVIRNGLWELTCESDPLVTFAAELRNLTGTVNRSEQLYNGYLNDPEYKALAYQNTVTKAFPNAITGDSFILMTVG